jgi:hypothetical protein
MKKLVIILLSLYSVQVIAQHKLIDLKLSKMHGLYTFYEALTDKPHSVKLLKDIFTGSSVFNSKKRNDIEKLIKDLKEFSAFSDIQYKSNTLTGKRESRRSLDQVVKIQSAYATDLTDWKSRTIGLVSIDQHKMFFDLMKDLLKLYEPQIWIKSLPKLKEYKNQLEAVMRQARSSYLFNKIVKFYNGNWSLKTPFVVALSPIPAIKGNTTAESLGIVESVTVLIHSKKYKDKFGVIIHEMAHSIYQSQTDDFKLKLEKVFKDSRSPFASLTYQYLDETLATAIGNGYAYQAAAKKVDKGEWYNNNYINGFAKAIYPLVKKYLKNERQIDRAFINQAIELFEKRFPRALFEINGHFEEIYLVCSENLDRKSIYSKLNKSFRVSSFYNSSPLLNAKSLSNFKKHNNKTRVIIFSESNISNYKKFIKENGHLVPSLKLLNMRDTEKIVTIIKKNHSPLIIIKVKNDESLEKAFNRLKNIKFFQEGLKSYNF